MKSFSFIFLLLAIQITYAQEPVQVNKAKRNALKLGTAPVPAKIFFSYEHAFAKHISVGGILSYGGVAFSGYSFAVFTRYYVGQFNQSGFFVTNVCFLNL
jgi:hypothetical protein